MESIFSFVTHVFDIIAENLLPDMVIIIDKLDNYAENYKYKLENIMKKRILFAIANR